MKRRTALVTGSEGGIGSAIRSVLHARDWTVIGVDVGPAKPASAGVGRYIQCDLSDPLETDALVHAVGTSLDALINNAAVQEVETLDRVERSSISRTLEVNTLAPMRLMQTMGPLMQQGSSVVNVGSVHAIASSKGMAAYAASKAALVALTRVAALEYGSQGICVNVVLPGAIDTKMLSAGLQGRVGGDERAARRELEERIPLGRIGRPEDVANLVAFLSDSALSGYITGQAFVVDGGVLARLSSE